MDKHDFKSLLAFYENQLFGQLMPFWLKKAMDKEHGGYFTGFNNLGDQLLHRYKFTWSQGRFVWLLARMARMFRGRVPQNDFHDLMRYAGLGAGFLSEHALLPNGNCAYSLTQDGRPIILDAQGKPRDPNPGEGHDASVYADLFVVYGMAEFARAAEDRRSYQFAADLYERAYDRFHSPGYRTEPYPVPKGFVTQGRSMILLETANELAQIAAHFEDPRAERFERDAQTQMEKILDFFRDPKTRRIKEMASDDPELDDSFLGRYACPGHTLEGMWFAIHYARRTNQPKRIEQAVGSMLAAIEMGWDREQGGLFWFTDRATGGKPAGPVPPALKGLELIKRYSENWDNKLWWPHSEGLYALLLAYEMTKDEAILDEYWRMHEYTFRVFPNPDPAIGEWIQIRDRSGAPEQKVLALPVKDPMHIARAFCMCIALLRRMTEA